MTTKNRTQKSMKRTISSDRPLLQCVLCYWPLMQAVARPDLKDHGSDDCPIGMEPLLERNNI